MEKLAAGARKFWPWALAIMASTVIATLVAMTIDQQGPSWWASRDAWDAAALLCGVTLGACLSMALVHEHYRRAAERNSLAVVVRLKIEQEFFDATPRGVAYVEVTVPGALKCSGSWHVTSATAKFHVLDDAAIHDREPQMSEQGGSDISFRMRHEFDFGKALEIARKFPGGGDWVNATSVVVATNHREFRYAQLECRMYVSPDVLSAARSPRPEPLAAPTSDVRPPRTTPTPTDAEKLNAEISAADVAKQRATYAAERERIEAAKASALYSGPRRHAPPESDAAKSAEVARKHEIWPAVRDRLLWLGDEHLACDQSHMRDERRFRRVHEYTCDLLSRAFGDRTRDEYRHAFDENAKHATPLAYGPDRGLDLLCHTHARYLKELSEDSTPTDLRSRFHLESQPSFDV